MTGGDRQPFLDLVRFGAALLVLFGHVRGLFFVGIADVDGAGVATKAFYLLTGVQYEAVILFFVVSGFLIGGRVWDLIERRRFDLAQYFVDRFTRIYVVLIPASLVVVVIASAGPVLFGDTRLFGVRPLQPTGITAGWTWAQVPCHLANLQPIACPVWGINPPLWSLGYEWVFYFVAPLLLGACYAPLHPLAKLAGAALVLAGIATLAPPPDPFGFLFAVWLLGAVSARTLARTSLPLPLGLAGIALVAACMILSRAKVAPQLATDGGVAVGLAIALACAPIVRVRIVDSLVRRGAAFSFSLYILHLPVALVIGAALEKLGWRRELAPPGLAAYVAFGITVALTMAVAYGFARLTEDHTAAVRRWLWRSSAMPKGAETRDVAVRL
jgi:peptidoglycan/LPS O-acetylase OafA/YrhL